MMPPIRMIVGPESAGQVADTVAVEEVERQVDQMGVEFVPQIGQTSFGDFLKKIGPDKTEAGLHDQNAEKEEGKVVQVAEETGTG